jgi:hypothetical protein
VISKIREIDAKSDWFQLRYSLTLLGGAAESTLPETGRLML